MYVVLGHLCRKDIFRRLHLRNAGRYAHWTKFESCCISLGMYHPLRRKWPCNIRMFSNSNIKHHRIHLPSESPRVGPTAFAWYLEWLPSREINFLERPIAHFLFACMLTSIPHTWPSQFLLCEICKKVLRIWNVLKRCIETILVFSGKEF